ncbi:MAG: xpsE [Gammaproteobacteria bacterium]|jgi:type IV pilus assembly protein PilB|nr:xpsE [Gammaproteobacteria bacterium]
MTKLYSYSSITGMAPHVSQESLLDEPLIKLVDQIIKEAIDQTASDIHIEPFANFCRVRYRRDGILYEANHIAMHLTSRFITRLKVMAQLDITEKRLPQDGHFQLYDIDIRINTCPTLFGEKIVLRLLNVNKTALNITKLGFSKIQKKIFLNHITQPQGMILITGPTGSGKTVTLYSALNYLNSIEKNISTVEDPIEIQLAGINQININPRIGLEFSTVLRTLLRQDPDIIMLGEIRDSETAHIAIQAAQTGHLVLTTLHTKNAWEAVTRLQSLGITSHDIISTVSLIVSQRLIRKLCQYCKKQENESYFHSKGCQHCLQGYKNRTGIYEFFTFTKKTSEMILTNNKIALHHQQQEEVFSTLYQSGMQLVRQGMTSIIELNRVVSPNIVESSTDMALLCTK